MKKTKALLLALAILIVALSPTASYRAPTIAADPNNDDWLHVEGNKIVDMYGNQVWLTGCNWFGFNTGTNVFDGVWSCNMREAIKGMADRGINFLRVPISTELLYQWSQGVYPSANVNDFVNPELEGMNSLELFDFAVQCCKEFGIKIMVDIHSPATDAMGHIYPVWYDGQFTTEIWISTLEWLTERYKNDDTILALDLKNEPHGTPGSELMAKWDGSTDLNNWKHAAETCAKRILAINPNILIVVEGVEVYPKPGYDYTAVDEWGKESKYFFNWWGGNLRGVRDYPINLGKHQKQLVYSPHDYGPLVHKQSWFYEGFNKDTLYNDCWRDNWAYIHEENIAPLLVGEWGGFMDGGDNEKWMTAIRDYMIENKISHTFWCYNANSGDTGGLVYYDFITWDEEKYALLKPSLWQTSDGKFIGLDHQIPLGSNGITVTEYYGGDFPEPSPTATVTPVPTPSPSPEIEKGDVNGDGSVNSTDAMWMKRFLLKLVDDFPTPTGKQAADMNDDGKINSSDMTAIKRKILKMTM
ncbi:cellulase family glycosylhydrolase [Acetivibrio straminisolvens]|uniref:cellulase family glycosylhydrolase n=1 Tax=Acetivibrio straminisolvens TaxID=253314 RepID=UPI0038993121